MEFVNFWFFQSRVKANQKEALTHIPGAIDEIPSGILNFRLLHTNSPAKEVFYGYLAANT